MGLFVGDPTPGYSSQIQFTADTDDAPTITLGCDMFDDDTTMAWNRANIFNAGGNADHSKGLTVGRVIGSGVWDTGASADAQTAIKVGAVGTLVTSLNAGADVQTSPAKCARWHVHTDAAGQTRFDVEFIKDNQIQNYDAEDANDATIGD